MVLRIVGSLRQLLHGNVGARQVGIAEAKINYVAARGPSGRLQAVNLRKNIRRQSGDPSKLHESTLLSAVASTYARANRRVGLEKRSG